MNPKPAILLASQSPRRQALIRLLTDRLDIQPANIDESPRPGEHPAAQVRRLAEEKARALQAVAGEQDFIVAADTTVADGERILGKPASPEEARAMLRDLRGHPHQVYTGVAVLHVSSGALHSAVESSLVHMRAYSEEEILAYVRSGDPLDKAGAYAIQNRDFHPVERLEGCFASVMGLPLCRLAALGLPYPADLPQRCQAHLEIDCTVYPAILNHHGDPDE